MMTTDPLAAVAKLLPPPFDWCEIPSGKVTLLNNCWGDKHAYLQRGKPQTFQINRYFIAKYPITNAQFAQFIESDGYNKSEWWTEAGWRAKTKGYQWINASVLQPTDTPWYEPRNWRDSNFNQEDQPIVGISWYEAVAFCRRLQTIIENLSLPEITLPTEQQWQRAAQGNDERIYPWGNEWDETRCNNATNELEHPTPVYLYAEKDISPYGVVDMAGNVHEWCLTQYYTGSQDVEGIAMRTLRGGSFLSFDAPARYDCSGSGFPHTYDINIGFRLVYSL